MGSRGSKGEVALFYNLLHRAEEASSVPEKIKLYRDLIDALKRAAVLLQGPCDEEKPLAIALSALMDIAMTKRQDSERPWWIADYSLFNWCMDSIERLVGRHPHDSSRP